MLKINIYLQINANKINDLRMRIFYNTCHYYYCNYFYYRYKCDWGIANTRYNNNYLNYFATKFTIIYLNEHIFFL